MKNVVLLFLSVLTLFSVCFAQSATNETLTITTYYPSPYGVYRNLRLNPSAEPTTGVGEGSMYYDNSTDMLRYRNDAEWVNITGAGCQLIPFTNLATASCDPGYYTWSANASGPSGDMLCCRIENAP
ncbi:MAG: hypothetical protein WCY10_00800 [Candidatus Omnitrophota bacterium]